MYHEEESTTQAFEAALSQLEVGSTHYVLRLFVAGSTARSLRAVDNVKRLCEAYLRGRYELEVVDIYRLPGAAEQEQVVAAPTLVRQLPEPLRRIVGDMADEGRVLMALGVRATA